MKNHRYQRLTAVLLVVALLLCILPVLASSSGSETRGSTFGLKGAYLHINEDLNLVYIASVPKGSTDVYMVFEMCGISTTVTDYTVAADGTYCFAYTMLSPIHMADNICATLHATVNGVQQTAVADDYSIKAYCTHMLEKYSDHAQMVTLLSDLLAYGDASQYYTGYHTQQLATEGVSVSPSEFTGLSGYRTSFAGIKSELADWRSASLMLSNELAIRFAFQAASVDGLTVKVSLNGRSREFSAKDITTVGNGGYYLIFRGVKATEFNDPVTAEFYRNGTKLGRAVTYSVNTYICNYLNAPSAPAFRSLLEALYNYGKSASAYQDMTHPSDRPGTTDPADDPEAPWIDIVTGVIDTEGWSALIP